MYITQVLYRFNFLTHKILSRLFLKVLQRVSTFYKKHWFYKIKATYTTICVTKCILEYKKFLISVTN